MKIKDYLLSNDTKKDILIYEYQNENEYILHFNYDKNIYEVFDLQNSSKIKDEKSEKIINDTAVLCEYQHDNLIVLQCDYNF